MSIRVRGTIVIERKHSRRGDFNVGDLSTEIGVFEVKDSIIEEFEPGKYSGEFLVRWIEPDSFSWRGRVFVKNRAQLDEILIDEAQEGAEASALPPEPDPIDAGRPEATAPLALPTPTASTAMPDPSSPVAAVPTPSSESPASPTPASTAAGQALTHEPPDEEPDLTLFGRDLFDALNERETIRLDPTVDRQQFRAQRDRLKALGYGFDAMSQAWSLREEETAEA